MKSIRLTLLFVWASLLSPYSFAQASTAAAAPATTENFTLQRARDYHFVAGDVGCPDCKDMYCSTLQPAASGAKIISIETVAQRPTRNNHWYRCQIAVNCGRPEFSDPKDAKLDCAGKTSCNVCRATNDAIGNYEDDIRVKYQ
jgi:hypothetical protein